MPNSTVPGLPSATTLDGTELFYTVQGGLDRKATGTQIAALNRIVLKANTTFYVSTTGNDTTGTGTAVNPWATVQHAIDYIASYIDIGGFVCAIELAAGTAGSPNVYAAVNSFPGFVGSGRIAIQTSDGDVTHTTLNGISVNCDTDTEIAFGGMTLTETTFEPLIIQGNVSVNIGTSNCGNVKFAPVSGRRCILSKDHATVRDNASGFITISPTGTAVGFLLGQDQSAAYLDNQGYIITGSPAWSDAFLSVTLGGYIASSLNSSGTATGKRFSVDAGSIFFHSGSFTAIPGDTQSMFPINAIVMGGSPTRFNTFPVTSVSSLGGLPAAAANLTGARALITDASSEPTFYGIAAGSSTTIAPVWCDGTNWRYG